MTFVRVAFRRAMREAAMSLLEGYKADVGVGMQLYRARPHSIHPPTAFIDSIEETLTSRSVNLQERKPQVNIIVLHGRYDDGEAVDQGDAFVDGFLEWCADRYHEAGSLTLLEPVATIDIPNFVADWLRTSSQPPPSYYATQITLEGYTTS